jgi:pimeloyl-ACP methyl ester carboxylesterase
MTIARFVLDCEELTEYLLRRFQQQKLFLVGHSWGSVLGMKFAAKRPDLLWAYIGIGQVVNMQKGEELSYVFTLNEARYRNNTKAIRQLEAIGLPPYKNMHDAGIQRDWLSQFHGVTFKGSIPRKMLGNVSLRDVHLRDIAKFVRGVIFSLSALEDEQMKVDLPNEITELKVPIYLCSGRRDYNAPFELAADFCEKLIAPSKRFVWFEQSAHLPNFEEPGKFCALCVSIKAEIFSSAVARTV